MTNDTDTKEGRPVIREAALFGSCPRCGARTLFDGWIAFADRCDKCGLNYSRFNVGDGPAAFLTLGIGTIIVALAVWLQLSFDPPWWLHVILWVPLTIIGVIVGLRVAKAWLLVAEYSRRAEEHRHDGSDLS